jgi:hypothetical protein
MSTFRAVTFLLACAGAACAEPPSKEMNQAQGAIDTARSASAEQFAPTELAAAVEALRRSEEAVVQRDYRLALNHAIESREHAQAAAKAAVNARARARGDIEGLLAEATTLLAQARARLRDPEIARLPRRAVQEPRTTIEAAQTSVQNARTAVNNDDYAAARKAIDGVGARIQRAIAALDAAANAPANRRRR